MQFISRKMHNPLAGKKSVLLEIIEWMPLGLKVLFKAAS